MRVSLCDGWAFTKAWDETFARGEGDFPTVRLPHTVEPLPLHHIDPADYQMICGYRRALDLPAGAKGKRVFLQFDGAAHIAAVYLNGAELAVHRCGYTAFRVELTAHLQPKDNLVAVKLDTTENPAVPPFGGAIDYLTFGGLYREVWLDVRPESYLADLFIHTPDLHTAQLQVTVDRPQADHYIEAAILDDKGKAIWEGTTDNATPSLTAQVPDAKPWDVQSPRLYLCRVTLKDKGGKALDTLDATFGFRTAQFKADGFYLNGRKVFLRGLNRHQCYPYVGYAAPASLQREDARVLREELGCNAVRTSHYPQSQHFIDACDRRGLLVFTEIPGWQHIGDEGWKDQAVENVREMVLQYRNHPSIVLWGVRINESMDDDPFYRRTNDLAHQLDPSRQTSGVRYLEKSHLLEDVYAFNDFSHSGANGGVRPKKAVTPDRGKALLISECNGHMYPTKPCDDWPHRLSHALRHARVQNDALADGDHAGCFGWCMFDYPTHQDFGSGDRVCYHGVLDAFRNPKLAAAVYASQGDSATVLEVGSSMDIGDYPGGQLGDVYVFSNAEQVALYKNGHFVGHLSKSGYSALPHPPFLADDTIGELLESQEGFDKGKAKTIRSCMLAAGKYGLSNLPLRYKLKLAWCMVRYKMSFQDGVDLYGKYVGNWGSEATTWRFDALEGGKVVASVTRAPSARLHLEVKASHTGLTEGDTYDMAAVRVRVLDENGAVAPYAQLPVRFELSGPGELVGPAVCTAEGGMCGAYLRTTGAAGQLRLTVSTDQTKPVTVNFTVRTAQ